MANIQTAILDPAMPHGRFMIMDLKNEVNIAELSQSIATVKIDKHIIIGFGANLLEKLSIKVQQYREFPLLISHVEIPATHGDLFIFIRDQEPGKVAIKSLAVKTLLSQYFDRRLQVNGFKYLGKTDGYGHDLTAYEDGTENPLGEDAVSAVVRADGSCFVALQQWQHDLNTFNGFPQELKDNTIGRRLSDNIELDDAPASSHVNRSDQGTFDINADILRRSMPWSNEHGEGLMFMAFCENLDRFEVQMVRMAGLDDGITDALFTFSKILNSAYFY
ncbi:MAG: Dyp-type peroxidase, partial [Alcanivoracaceae bacterium]|nr:Dyp-type peroxidase [Alcanivoracaceae bacterium]